MSHPYDFSGALRELPEPVPPLSLRKIGLYATVAVLCVNSLLIICFPVRRAPDVPVEVIFNLFNYCTNVTVDRFLGLAGWIPTYKFVRGPDDYGRLFLHALAGAMMWGTIATGVVWTSRRMEER